MIIVSNSALCQDLVMYEISDLFNPNLYPGIRFLNASFLTGYGHDFQYRNEFPKNDIFFGRAHISGYIHSKSEFISAYQFDWKLIRHYNLSQSQDLSLAFNSVPLYINSLQASAYLAEDEYLEEAHRFRFSWNRYNFSDHKVNEYSLELNVVLDFINELKMTGGFIFTRDPNNNRNYYGLGYRYDIFYNEKGHNLQVGISYTRQKNNGIDKSGKFKVDLIQKLVLFRNTNSNLYLAYARNYIEKSNNFELGLFFGFRFFTFVKLKEQTLY